MHERHEVMEDRLREWAAWLTSRATGDGYASMSVIHPDWTPPASGASPTLRVGRSNAQRERRLHHAIVQLSARLQATLLVHYCLRLSMADQAARLECAPATVHMRVREAKALLAQALQQG